MMHECWDRGEEQFAEWLVEQYGRRSGPNDEAFAIFKAVMVVFSEVAPNAPHVSVPESLIHNLAACTWVCLEYDKDERVPIDTGRHDNVLNNLLRILMLYLTDAIRKGEAKRSLRGEGYVVRGLRVPDWFVDSLSPERN